LIPITVHVPDHRVEEFYIRFGEFISNIRHPEDPLRLPSGTVPSWVQTDDAPKLAAKLWEEVSLPGHAVLNYLVRATKTETVHLRPEEIAEAMSHPKGKSGIAGILGGVGKAIRRASLPTYTTPNGDSWHYIWDWDGERYSMAPEVAEVLRLAERKRK